MKRNLELEAIVDPVLSGMGYELVGLEYLPQGKHSTLRIYIDKPGGVSIDDCEKASRQVGAVLDVEAAQLTRGAYNLEVSSPGVDRKIFSLVQFPRFIGQLVHLTLYSPLNGQRNYKGILNAVNGEQILVEVDDKIVEIDFANVAQANVIDRVAK